MNIHTVWICPECKSTDVRELVWVNPNDKGSYDAGYSNTKYRCESCSRDLNHLDDVAIEKDSQEMAVDMVKYLTGCD